MNPIAQLDHQFVWHPFTQMRDWLKSEPIVLTAGRGAVLRDVRGRSFLDANSSIWTNLHGHNHPALNRALKRQLNQVAHVSALGFANEPAARLAARLVKAARPPLRKVFFSDNGSTALEVALKLAYETARRTGLSPKPRFASLAGAYHGDTIGAVALGHIDLFHKAWSGMLFPTAQVMSPYCYRCPFNRARPERADARTYRRCQWECVASAEKVFSRAKKLGRPITGFVFEPEMQGAAGMIPQPDGWLQSVTRIAREHGALLIADEVMTGFGRTGIPGANPASPGARALFACQLRGVQPDFLCLAKGLTGGYLPMAATLTTQPVFDAFLGRYDEFKSFFHGHSYTGNPLGAATGLASLDLLESPASRRQRARLQSHLQDQLQSLWKLPRVGDVRQTGLVAGIELVADWKTRRAYPLRERAGIRVAESMARRGVLTRPIGNVIVLMPPYCTTEEQLEKMIAALRAAIREALA
ncbi:MAG: adenosylmethionine--8-amino-7-oxononanoate transaminase [Verrucomicrobiota bacterium]